MSRRMDDFDWAKAVYDLAVDQSTTIEGMVDAARLNPLAGDVSDMDLSELDLSNQDLSGWDLLDANMQGTVLKGTRLVGAKINPHNLLKARGWKEAELDEALRRKALELEAAVELAFKPLLKKVDELELSVKAAKGIKDNNIVYIGDLVQMSTEEISRTPSIGKRHLNEIERALSSMGLRLGMEVPNWPPENIEELAAAFEGEY